MYNKYHNLFGDASLFSRNEGWHFLTFVKQNKKSSSFTCANSPTNNKNVIHVRAQLSPHFFLRNPEAIIFSEYV